MQSENRSRSPGSSQSPKGDSVQVEYYDDRETGGSFGYLKVTLDAKAHTLTCQFMAIRNGKVVELDGQTTSI